MRPLFASLACLAVLLTLLKLNAYALQAVQKEGTPLLPGVIIPLR